MFNGRPIYVNSYGKYLHVWNKGNWGVGYKIGSYGIKSTGAPLNADHADNWVSAYGLPDDDDIPIDISIECKDI